MLPDMKRKRTRAEIAADKKRTGRPLGQWILEPRRQELGER